MSLLLHVSHLQVSVMMTLSKMVLPFTCHRSKPMNPKSSYLYLGFLLNWQSIFNTKRCAMVNTREHVIVELLVEAVLLANDKLSRTQHFSIYLLQLKFVNITTQHLRLYHIPDLERTWMDQNVDPLEAFRGQWSMVSISAEFWQGASCHHPQTQGSQSSWPPTCPCRQGWRFASQSIHLATELGEAKKYVGMRMKWPEDLKPVFVWQRKLFWVGSQKKFLSKSHRLTWLEQNHLGQWPMWPSAKNVKKRLGVPLYSGLSIIGASHSPSSSSSQSSGFLALEVAIDFFPKHENACTLI